MNDLNKVMVIGRLTKDAELTFMNSGSAKLEFSIAFTTSKKSGNEWVDESNYLNGLAVWGKSAENLKPYLVRGTLVGIEGHLKMDSWEKDGQKHSLLKVVVDNVQLLSRANNGAEKPSKPATSEGFQEDIPYSDDSEDIPF